MPSRYKVQLLVGGSLALAVLIGGISSAYAADNVPASKQPATSSGNVQQRDTRSGTSAVPPLKSPGVAARAGGGLQYSCPTTSTLCGCRGAADCKVLEGAGKCSGTLECTFATASGQMECTCRRKAAIVQ
jgi:hypothetical protein